MAPYLYYPSKVYIRPYDGLPIAMAGGVPGYNDLSRSLSTLLAKLHPWEIGIADRGYAGNSRMLTPFPDVSFLINKKAKKSKRGRAKAKSGILHPLEGWQK